MLRIGIVDCDTSHVVQFTMRLNHVGIDEEQWVDGANIVAAVPLPSEILEQEKIDEIVIAAERASHLNRQLLEEAANEIRWWLDIPFAYN